MLDYGEYSTVPDYQQGGDGSNPLSYEQHLEGDWGLFYKIASYFIHKVRFDDRQDFLHDLMLEMATVKAKYEVKGKPLTEAGLMRVASYELSEYWVKLRRLTTWLDCGHCSNRQRKKCKADDLYTECPRAIKIESLNKPIVGEDGHISELAELIADDKAIDLEAWLNEATWRLGYPQRLVDIVQKIAYDRPLTNEEHQYLWRFRQKEQKGSFDRKISPPKSQSI